MESRVLGSLEEDGIRPTLVSDVLLSLTILSWFESFPLLMTSGAGSSCVLGSARESLESDNFAVIPILRDKIVVSGALAAYVPEAIQLSMNKQ